MKPPSPTTPETVYRTGTEAFTILDAHPYHAPVGRLDHHGAGTYRRAYRPECPCCRHAMTRRRVPPGEVPPAAEE
jgi:hypothetical protein